MHSETQRRVSVGSDLPGTGTDRRWQAYIDIVGADLFLRYRKRLTRPGVAFEIWRDNPRLSLVDVLVRVYAARKIVAQGDDFRALRALRSATLATRTRRESGVHPVAVPDSDRLSVGLVRLGGWLFSGFCLLSAVSAGWPSALIAALLLCVALAATWRWRGSRVHRRAAHRRHDPVPAHDGVTAMLADQQTLPRAS